MHLHVDDTELAERHEHLKPFVPAKWLDGLSSLVTQQILAAAKGR